MTIKPDDKPANILNIRIKKKTFLRMKSDVKNVTLVGSSITTESRDGKEEKEDECIDGVCGEADANVVSLIASGDGVESRPSRDRDRETTVGEAGGVFVSTDVYLRSAMFCCLCLLRSD